MAVRTAISLALAVARDMSSVAMFAQAIEQQEKHRSCQQQERLAVLGAQQ